MLIRHPKCGAVVTREFGGAVAGMMLGTVIDTRLSIPPALQPPSDYLVSVPIVVAARLPMTTTSSRCQPAACRPAPSVALIGRPTSAPRASGAIAQWATCGRMSPPPDR
jgi:hypothetical protein